MKIEVNTHEKNMIRFAAEHPEVLVMSADLGSSCEVKKFRQTYPDRYLTMGIACLLYTSFSSSPDKTTAGCAAFVCSSSRLFSV